MHTWNTLPFSFSVVIIKYNFCHVFFIFLINVLIAKGLKVEIIIISMQYALLLLPYRYILQQSMDMLCPLGHLVTYGPASNILFQFSLSLMFLLNVTNSQVLHPNVNFAGVSTIECIDPSSWTFIYIDILVSCQSCYVLFPKFNLLLISSQNCTPILMIFLNAYFF